MTLAAMVTILLSVINHVVPIANIMLILPSLGYLVLGRFDKGKLSLLLEVTVVLEYSGALKAQIR